MSKKQSEIAEFSPRSQSSILRESELQQTIRGIQVVIKRREGEIAETERNRARWLKDSLKATTDHALLHASAENLKKDREFLAIDKERLAVAEAEIAKLQLTPAQAKARAERQAEIAALAAERLEKDGEIDKAIDAVRALFEQRAQLTEKMRLAAAEIDLQADLDGDRADGLFAELPENFAEPSRAWFAWFTGSQPDANSYVVHAERLILPETLASAGIYEFGDAIELTENEAGNVLGLSAHPDRKIETAYGSSQIVTPEQHETATSEAEQSGNTLRECRLGLICKVRSNVHLGGECYVPGDVIDLHELTSMQRQQLYESGAIERV